MIFSTGMHTIEEQASQTFQQEQQRESVVSQARPLPFHSTDCFQYRHVLQYQHVEKGSGDLEPLHMNTWNAIIESVTCKALPTGIPVSGPPPASIITPYAISATQLLHMRSTMEVP